MNEFGGGDGRERMVAVRGEPGGGRPRGGGGCNGQLPHESDFCIAYGEAAVAVAVTVNFPTRVISV